MATDNPNTEPKMDSLFDEEEVKSIEKILEPEIVETQITPSSIVNIYKRSLLTSNGLSFKGQRLLRVVLSLIKPTDKAGKVYSFNIDEYKAIYGIEEHSSKQLKDAGRELTIPRDFNSETDPEAYTISGLISYLDVQNGVATFSIAPSLLPLYNDVKKKMQHYLLGYIRKFESRYSFSFYELFLEMLAENTENPNGVIFYKPIDHLRKWLRIEDKYIDIRTGNFAYNNFRLRILEPVLRDINAKDDEGCLCDINFSYEAKRVGRKVVGITFNVWRTNAKPVEEPKVNPFYDNLSHDIRMLYDFFLKLNVSQQTIEKAILQFGDEEFMKIARYVAKVKYKGPAYVAAILKNGITSSTWQGIENFNNIEKAYIISEANKKRFQDVEEFFAKSKPDVQEMVLKTTKNVLKNQPLIFKHIVDMSALEILESKEIKVFFLERLVDIIFNAENSTVLKAYQDYYEKLEKETKDIEIKTDRTIVQEFKKYGIHPKMWAELLTYDDAYIEANIQYCINTYQRKKNQKDIAGAIVKAVRDDYAQYNIAKKEADLQAKKRKEAQELSDAFNRLMGQDSNAALTAPIITQVDIENEFEQACEDFMLNATDGEKENIKNIILTNASHTQKMHWCRTFKVEEEKLAEIPFEKMIGNPIFKVAFKLAYRKELGL